LTTRCEKKGLQYCVLGGMAFFAAVILCPSVTDAAPVTFTIDNKVERTQELNAGIWVYSDLINQSYQLKWNYAFSSRLKAGTVFKLTMDDTLKSQDIDTKTVTPSVEITLDSVVWDLTFTAKDSAVFSNEFNTPRHDTIDAGVDLSLTPFLLPALKASYKVNDDYQKDLFDTRQGKLDLSTSYTFDLFTVDGAWRQGKKEDFLRVNSDTENSGWDFNLSYNQPLTPALRLAYTSALTADRLDTFDHDTRIIAIPPTLTHLITNKVKLEWDGFPSVTSYIELGRERAIPTDDTKDTVNFQATATQILLSLGTAKESVTYTSTAEVSPTIDTADGTWLYSLEMAGSPYRYVDYAAKYTLEDLNKSATLPVDDVATRTGKLDLSTTINPALPLTLNLGYNQEIKDSNGVRASESSTFKVKGTFQGEFLDIPNLIFTPTADINRERSFSADTYLRTEDLKLDFKYHLSLPSPLRLELGPSYGWIRSDGKTTDNYYSLSYNMEARGKAGGWGLNLLMSGEFKNTLGPKDGSGVWTMARDGEVTIARKLTRTLAFKTTYRYKIPADSAAGDSDSAELGLRWDFLQMNAEVTVTRDRTFAVTPVDTRKIVARFGMTF
jgi:hypothetical protein